MRKWILTLAAMTLLAAACAEETPPADGDTHRSSAEENQTAADVHGRVPCGPLRARHAHDRHRQPRVQPWYGGKSDAGSEWKSATSPATRTAARDTRARSRTTWPRRWASPRPGGLGRASRSTSRSRRAPRTSTSPCNRSPITDEAGAGRRLQRRLLRRQPGTDGERGLAAIGVTTLAGLKDLKLGAPIGTTSLQVDRGGGAADAGAEVFDDLDLR